MDRRAFICSTAALHYLTASTERTDMQRRPINSFGPEATYAPAHEIAGAGRIVFVSGQVPEKDDVVPKDFKSQCRLAWANVEEQLKAENMTLADIVKFTIFLSDRAFRQEEWEVRKEVLSSRKQPAMTIIITGIYDEAWLLEIEAIAAA